MTQAGTAAETLSEASGTRRRGRPPRAPADADARRRLIRSGLEHLTEKGYSAVGIDEILRDAGVPKGGFYHYFPGKAAFGLALVSSGGAWNMARTPCADSARAPHAPPASVAARTTRRQCWLGAGLRSSDAKEAS